ncbi:MAG TPA: hypothetical protein GXX36_01660 [Clostridiaceae bacterium]|nr:hypothetical protein [Clostridiaceae bacterium]
MKSKGIGIGIFLLLAGVFLLLINLRIINWSIFYAIVDLWPLFLVAIGINIIAGKRQAIKIITWVLLLAVFVTYGYINRGKYNRNNAQDGNRVYTVEKLAETEKGDLKLSLGGLSFNIGPERDYLLEGVATKPAIKYSVDYDDGNRIARIDIKQANERFIVDNVTGRNGYSYELNLNDNVKWDIDAKIGAVSGTMDLSDIRVDDLDADLGAGKLDIIFGTANEITNVKINAGASKVGLVFPEEAGVRLKVKGMFNSNDLGNLNWKEEDGYYISPNYDEALSKINVDISMGIGQLSVEVKK